MSESVNLLFFHYLFYYAFFAWKCQAKWLRHYLIALLNQKFSVKHFSLKYSISPSLQTKNIKYSFKDRSFIPSCILNFSPKNNCMSLERFFSYIPKILHADVFQTRQSHSHHASSTTKTQTYSGLSSDLQIIPVV